MSGWYAPAEHTKHVMSRLISEADDGTGLFGCAHPRCSVTEVRRRGERSPIEAAQAEKAIRKAERKRDRAQARGGA